MISDNDLPSRRKDKFQDMPHDVMVYIFSFINKKDLLNTMLLSKRLLNFYLISMAELQSKKYYEQTKSKIYLSLEEKLDLLRSNILIKIPNELQDYIEFIILSYLGKISYRSGVIIIQINSEKTALLEFDSTKILDLLVKERPFKSIRSKVTSAIDELVERGLFKVIFYFVDAINAVSKSKNITTTFFNSPLTNSPQCIELLNSALYSACKFGNLEVAQEVVKKGASIDGRNTNLPNDNTLTPIFAALQHNESVTYALITFFIKNDAKLISTLSSTTGIELLSEAFSNFNKGKKLDSLEIFIQLYKCIWKKGEINENIKKDNYVSKKIETCLKAVKIWENYSLNVNDTIKAITSVLKNIITDWLLNTYTPFKMTISEWVQTYEKIISKTLDQDAHERAAKCNRIYLGLNEFKEQVCSYLKKISEETPTLKSIAVNIKQLMELYRQFYDTFEAMEPLKDYFNELIIPLTFLYTEVIDYAENFKEEQIAETSIRNSNH